MGVVEERAVAVHAWIDSLGEDASNSTRVERRSEFCAVGVLNAMHRPEDLFDTVEYDAIAGLFTRMIRGETTVIGRMPILCGKNQRETLLQFVGQRNDFVTVRDRQRPAGQKIVLKIDNDQRIHSTRSRCSFAREINLDLNSCSEFSRPTPYRRGFSNFKISGGEQLSCIRARSRDAWIGGTR